MCKCSASPKQDHNVECDTEAPQPAGGATATIATGHCPVMEQKEEQSGLKDEACARDVKPHQAGLCK